MLSDYLQLELMNANASPLREAGYQTQKSESPACYLIFGLSNVIFPLLDKIIAPIYLFETNLSILRTFLESNLTRPVTIIENIAALETHAKTYLFKASTLFFLSEFSDYLELYTALKSNLQLRVIQHAYGLSDEISSCIAHHFSTFHPLLKSYQNAFLGLPALIVGAGPSLQKNAKVLKELSQSCVVFAALNAVTTLEKAEIDVDFYGIIDPRKGFELSNKVYETPIFFRSSALFSETEKFKSKIFVGDGGQNAPLSFFEGLFENPALGLEAGYTVSNFLFHIATFLGCCPIILVGQDLAFLEGEKYAGVKASIPELLQFEGKDAKGKVLQTTKDFYLSKKWFESHLQSEGEYYNLSDGLYLEGFKTLIPQAFKAISKKGLSKQLMRTTIKLCEKKDKLMELFQNIERAQELKKSQIPDSLKVILLESDIKEMKLFEYFEEIFTLFSYLNPLLPTQKFNFYYTLLSDLKGKLAPWIQK